MITVEAATIGSWLGSIAWPFLRIGAFCMVAPVIGTQLVPARIRLLFALTLTAIIVPVLPQAPAIELLSPMAVVVAAQEILIGVALATVLQLLLHLFVMAGQIVAMQMGLGFASMVDPANGVSVTVMSQLYLMLVTLLFIAVDGHLAMIQVLSESFVVLPPAQAPSGNLAWQLVLHGSWMFVAATLLSLPAITALLVVNASLGIVTRAAPQLNIFAIGFPMMLVLGLVIVWLTLGALGPHFQRLTEEALLTMRTLLN